MLSLPSHATDPFPTQREISKDIDMHIPPFAHHDASSELLGTRLGEVLLAVTLRG